MPFRPLKGNHVRMYTCGPTVWDYTHIGNFRTFIFEDLLRRYLELKGFKVTQVKNITDVEDRIIQGMKKTQKSLKELTSFYEDAFMQDGGALGMERAEFYPHATQHIVEMVELIKVLLKRGYAYKGGDGSIYYDVSKFKAYGKLSGIKVGELKVGARVAQDHYEKGEGQDFALWKTWDQEDGEVFWNTEFGKGRPGWHVECSAMAMKYLGESFDIHTGGKDLKFPHHENEIAQSEAATGRRFARYWLHSDFLSIEGEEMHKSSGNIVTLRDLLGRGWAPRTIRLFLLSAHYRDPINLNENALRQAEAQRQRLTQFIARLRAVPRGVSPRRRRSLGRKLLVAFQKSMDQDLNTPMAFAAIFSFLTKVNTMVDKRGIFRDEAREILKALSTIEAVLGIMTFEQNKLPPQMMALIKEREAARKNRDFAKADQIRESLLNEGVTLEDTPTGTIWRAERGRGSQIG